MSAPQPRFNPGNLIRARGREWVVQAGSDSDWLRLRPLGGSDDDNIALKNELTPGGHSIDAHSDS